MKQNGIFHGKSGFQNVGVNVGKTLFTAVAVGDAGGNDHNIPFPVRHGLVFKMQSAGSPGTVDELPTGMEMTGYRIRQKMLSGIDNLIHQSVNLSLGMDSAF